MKKSNVTEVTNSKCAPSKYTTDNQLISVKPKYFYCNVISIIKFVFPMVLSSLSANIMFVCDRMVLAYYSIDSMTAAAIAGSLVIIPTFFAINITGIAVVFVGQLNGEEKFKNVGEPVWQMVYLGILLSIIFALSSIFLENFTSIPPYYKTEGLLYQKILMAFSGIPAISCAISSFFVGIGSSITVVLIVGICNILNLLLDICLIFGIDGIVPEMGINGAAIATIIAQLTQLTILFLLFIAKDNRKTYSTTNCILKKDLFAQCVKTGFPLSITRVTEMLAWYLMFLCLSYASRDFATIESIAISIVSFFMFFADGINRASASLYANLIGQNDINGAKHLFGLFVYLNALVCAIFAIPLIVKQEIIFWIIGYAEGNIRHLYCSFSFVFISIWISVFLDGIYCIMTGAMQAGGDTKFQMYLNTSTLWMLVVFPVAVMYYTQKLTSIETVYIIIVARSFVSVLIAYNRYRKFNWFRQFNSVTSAF